MADPTSSLVVQRIKHLHTITGRIQGFPEFYHIGFDILTRVQGLRTHGHPGMFEFCAIVRGHVKWCVQDRLYELHGGDVYFTRPDEPHGGLQEMLHPCMLYCIQMKVPAPGGKRAGRFLNLPPAESLALVSAIHAMKDRRRRGAEKLEPYFQAILRHLESGGPFGVTQARASLQCMLATLATLPPATAPAGFIPPGVVRVREHIEKDPCPWPGVADLARIAGMSVSHFHACFLREVGMAPMEYAHRVRLDRAQALLAVPGATVRSVAERLGYCSPQHLAVCCRRYLGRTPSDAAQRVRELGSVGH